MGLTAHFWNNVRGGTVYIYSYICIYSIFLKVSPKSHGTLCIYKFVIYLMRRFLIQLAAASNSYLCHSCVSKLLSWTVQEALFYCAVSYSDFSLSLPFPWLLPMSFLVFFLWDVMSSASSPSFSFVSLALSTSQILDHVLVWHLK